MLYAYIKIPDIGGSESTDQLYDSSWIPLKSVELEDAHTHPLADDDDDPTFTIGISEKNKPQQQRIHDEEAKSKPRKTCDDGAGSIEITKLIDSTSTTFHLYCVQNLKSGGRALSGKIEIHICRHRVEHGDSGNLYAQVYMAYIMEGCAISQIDVDASEGGKFTETITITFEKISFCIRPPGAAWNTKGWDFKSETQITGGTPTPPTPKRPSK